MGQHVLVDIATTIHLLHGRYHHISFKTSARHILERLLQHTLILMTIRTLDTVSILPSNMVRRLNKRAFCASMAAYKRQTDI